MSCFGTGLRYYSEMVWFLATLLTISLIQPAAAADLAVSPVQQREAKVFSRKPPFSRRLGYSTACSSQWVIASDYEAFDNAGAIIVWRSRDVEARGIDAAPHLIIKSSKHRGLLRAAHDLWRDITRRARNEQLVWFGHEVDVGDINNDGVDDVFVGARFDDEGRGSAYLFDGTALERIFGTGIVDASDLVETGSAKRYTPRDTTEFGFSGVIVKGAAIVRQSNGPDGEPGRGSVALLRWDDATEPIFFAPPNAMDFGRVITTSDQDVFFGSLSSGGWVMNLETHRFKTIAAASPGQSITPIPVHTKSGRIIVTVFGDQSDPSKNFLTVSVGKKTLRFSAPGKTGSWFGLSAISGDLDHDGNDDIVISDPMLGALTLISGVDLVRGLAQNTNLNATSVALNPPAGSKRRQCLLQRHDGMYDYIAGSPYGGGAVVQLSDVKRYTKHRDEE